MHEAIVRMENAGRDYMQGKRAVEALVSATCTVMPGDRIAVMGPSGSGKSTLLHLMGGLDLPTKGRVDWPALGEYKTLRPKQIGFVFQVQSLLPSLNVVENVKLPLALLGADAAEAHASAVEILKRMELDWLADKLPEELSGGQLQRIAIARALVTEPQLILADEPTGQLDHPTAQNLLDILLEHIEGTGAALVVATHDAAIAERMHTVWKIQHGILEVKRQ